MIQNNVLDIAIQIAKRIGATAPTTIEDEADTSAQRILGQINNELEFLVEEFDWQVLRKTASFTTDGSTSYDLNTIAPGFSAFNSFKLWDYTNQRTSSGLTPDEAQANAVWNNATIYRNFIIRDNKICFVPNLSATENRTFGFEYDSEYPTKDASDVLKQYANLNTDIPLFPAKIIIRGAIYRWKAEQGQIYTEEKHDYLLMLEKLKNRDKDKKVIVQGSPSRSEYGNIPDTGVGL